MATLWLDLETYSETPIAHGTFRYAADSEIMLVSYAVDDGPVWVWDVARQPMPPILRLALTSGCEIVAHNAQFDMNVLWLAKNSDDLMRAAGAAIERWRCTMAQALSHALPAKLSALGTLLELPAEMLKDEGYDLIMLFCKPQTRGKVKRATQETHPEEWGRFVRYAGQDIVAMRECARKMPTWNWQARDIAAWHYDQRINRRGFAVDIELAYAAIDLCAAANGENKATTTAITDGAVTSVTQRVKLVKHLLAEYGVDLPDMRAPTLERRIEDPDLPWAARELLALRLTGAKNSVSKYRTITRAVSDDNRLRGSVQFRGAMRTGRDAGRVFQPQNLPRPKSKAPEIEEWIEAAKVGATQLAGFDDIAMASDALRGLIVAGPGRKIAQADYSNIEGRLVAWLAGVEWKLAAFRDFDTIVGVDHRGEPIRKGPDLYRVTYGRSFNKPVDAVTGDERQIGKVIELACGYQGAVGAFQTMAAIYGVSVPDETALRLVRAWRAAHPEVVRLWYALEETAVLAIQNPGRKFEVNDKLAMARSGNWLLIRLPSKRLLCYPNVGLDRDGRIEFAGQNQYTRKWQRVQTYGGKLFENVVQGIAADLLWDAIPRVEAAEYPVILRVHDELLTEPLDDPSYSVDGLVALMTDTPDWAAGLPVAAAGFETYRYRKG